MWELAEHYLLSGDRAFTGTTSVDTMSAILHSDPPDLSQSKRPVPLAADRLIRHCLEKSSSERFQSARQDAGADSQLCALPPLQR